MPAIQCPVDGCSYSTPDDLDPVVVAALLNAHTTSHSNANSGGTNQQHMDTDKSDRRKDAKCIFCNEVGHGRSSKLAQRRRQCPAFGHECKMCKRQNHFEGVCRGSSKILKSNKTVIHNFSTNDTIFTSHCMTQNKTCHDNRLSHHVYDPSSDSWLNRVSQPQPIIQLQASLHVDDYSSLGYQLPNRKQSVTVTALADTGCQSCMAGMNLLQHLNLQKDDLIPTKMVMHAANNKTINILGAVVVRLKTLSKNATETRQMIYITTDTEMFISREACVALGIIPKTFPAATQIEIRATTESSSLTQQTNPVRVTAQFDVSPHLFLPSYHVPQHPGTAKR